MARTAKKPELIKAWVGTYEKTGEGFEFRIYGNGLAYTRRLQDGVVVTKWHCMNAFDCSGAIPWGLDRAEHHVQVEDQDWSVVAQ